MAISAVWKDSLPKEVVMKLRGSASPRAVGVIGPALARHGARVGTWELGVGSWELGVAPRVSLSARCGARDGGAQRALNRLIAHGVGRTSDVLGSGVL